MRRRRPRRGQSEVILEDDFGLDSFLGTTLGKNQSGSGIKPLLQGRKKNRKAGASSRHLKFSFRSKAQGGGKPPHFQSTPKLLLLFRGAGLGGFFGDHSLGSGQASHGYPERRTTDVGEADAVTEHNAVGVPAVFPADAQLDAGPGLLPLGNRDFHELADAALVNGGKRVLFDDFEFLIGSEEGAGVVTAHAERGLGEVIGAKAEELRGLCDFVGGEGAARNLDHGADQIVKLDAFFFHHLLGDAVDDFDLEVELLFEADERDHDFGMNLNAGFLNVGGSLEDSARLHFGDFGINDAEAAATEAQHGIEFM